MIDKVDVLVASDKEIKKAARILNKSSFPYTGCRKLKFDKKELEIALIAKEKNEILGFCYAERKSKDDRTRKTAYIGCFIKPGSQSKGIGTQLTKQLIELLKKKGFMRAECDIAEENIASRKVMKKLGFKEEGILKKRFLTDDGRLINDYWYGKIIK